MALRVLLVDDEPPALQRLVHTLASIENVEIAGTAEDGRAALELAESLKPDLVLLDIEMPYLNGIEVGQALSERSDIEIIFITALDEFAVEAFNMHAVDYLLKPVQPDRLREALKRARLRLDLRRQEPASEERSDAQQSAASSDAGPVFWVPKGDSTIRLSAKEIRRIEAARDYALLYTEANTFILKITMKELESRLQQQDIIRVHRSAFVRPDIVVQADFSGRRIVRLHTQDGAVVDVASKYAEKVQAALETA
ncbi:response regulator transcription factor [Allosphingosinicella flava]|uniref:Response regulator transcription factor n=1 Tax=Allosphingosinicella flava TaxID=2771430 RepID=A0A7T2GJJ1_9SPHN|nr:LytTR family DNA-binding domain-containing protein [Sphingosinicella flava]QPQ55047.1 response regulator transcription factor [Sphingosinicella flava]